MRKKIFFLILLSLSSCFNQNSNDEFYSRKMPQTRFFLRDGNTISSKEFIGKPLVVMFWGEWCPHCRGQIIPYNQIAGDRKYYNKVKFLAASVDSEADYQAYSNYIKEKKLDNLLHAFSGNSTADEAYIVWRADDLPHFFVINAKGQLALETHDVDDVDELLQESISN